jgi:Sec-independent protein translocase protein TatA
MKKKLASSVLLVLSLVVLMVLGAPSKIPAKSGCSNASLQGS